MNCRADENLRIETHMRKKRPNTGQDRTKTSNVHSHLYIVDKALINAA